MAERSPHLIEWYAQPRYRPFSLLHEDDRDDRAGVLMIHGFTGTPDELRASAEIAHGAGFDVEVMGLPGHGADIASFRTVTRDDWLGAARAAWADVRHRYRQHLLVGYSLGGALAIHVAAEAPPAAMLLMAPLIRIADRRAVALPLVQRVMREVMPFANLDFSKQHVREFFATAVPGIEVEQQEVQDAIRDEYVMPVRLLNECRIVGRAAGRLAPSLRMPVTIIQGRPDDIVGHRHARWLVDHLGGPVRYHEIPGDHLIPFTAAASWPEVSDMVRRWFAHRRRELG